MGGDKLSSTSDMPAIRNGGAFDVKDLPAVEGLETGVLPAKTPALIHSKGDLELVRPLILGNAIMYYRTVEGEGVFSVINETSISPTSKSVHYGLTYFDGGRIDIVRNSDGTHRLNKVHLPWNQRRLERAGEHSNIPHPRLPGNELDRVVDTLLYANMFDQPEIKALDGSGKPADNIYFRNFYFQVDANDIRLRTNGPFVYGLILSPQLPYHAGGNAEPMAVLAVPQNRDVPFARQKHSSNYGISTHWVNIMSGVFLPWLTDKQPKIIFDGNEVLGPKREELVALLKTKLKEPIFHNGRGKLTEASAENIGGLKDGYLYTPPISEGALPGFTMQKVELIADKFGAVPKRESFTLEQFIGFDACFATGNAAKVADIDMVVECDWDESDYGDYTPKGEVRITTVGNAKGKAVVEQIRGQLDKMHRNESEIGRLGCFADLSVTNWDVRNIREMTADLLRSHNKSIRAQVFGTSHPDSMPRLNDGRKLAYGKLLKLG